MAALWRVISSVTAGVAVLVSGCVSLRPMGLSLDEFMEAKRTAMDVPGLAVGVITPDGASWEGYYGMATAETAVTADTLFMIASVSKLVVATAVMQQWEAGRLDLDDDINDYLPFSARNPRYPERPITIRQLMTHRSSISDRYPLYDDLYTIDAGGGDYPGELGTFLGDYLSPGGDYYAPENFTHAAPGAKFDYSNYGAALLAYIVEIVSGRPFYDYCREEIFDPLGMYESYYLLSEIPHGASIAVPHYLGEALPHYSYPDYPSGSLRLPLRDLGRFTAFYLDPSRPDNPILHDGTVAKMWQEYGQSTDTGEGEMGLIWVHWNALLLCGIGHSGGDPGVSTFLSLYPEEGYGIIVMMNGNPSRYLYVRQIIKELRTRYPVR